MKKAIRCSASTRKLPNLADELRSCARDPNDLPPAAAGRPDEIIFIFKVQAASIGPGPGRTAPGAGKPHIRKGSADGSSTPACVRWSLLLLRRLVRQLAVGGMGGFQNMFIQFIEGGAKSAQTSHHDRTLQRSDE